MSHTFTYLVTVELERESGKFASRDEMSEPISSALEDAAENAEVTGLGAESSSDYSVQSVSVEELDARAERDARAEYDEHVVQQLPGDAALRTANKELRRQLAAAWRHVHNLQERLEAKAAEDATHATRIYLQDDHDKPRRYLPDGRYSDVYFQYGDDERERFSIQLSDEGGIELRDQSFGIGTLAVAPMSGNVIRVFTVPR